MTLDTRSSPGSAVGTPGRSGASDLAIEITALVGRRLEHVRAAPGRLVGVILNPLVMLVAVGYLFAGAVAGGDGDRPYVDYLFGGVILQVGLASIGPTATSISLDLSRGLMDRFRSLPIRRMGVLVAHSIADLLIGMMALAIVTLVGLALGWRSLSGPLETMGGFLVAVLFVYACVWVGILLGVQVKQVESIDSIGSLVLVSLTFLSNAILAPSGLPEWLRPIAEWNPVSIVADLCRGAWGNRTSGAQGAIAEAPSIVAASLFVLVVVSAALIGGRRFRRGA